MVGSREFGLPLGGWLDNRRSGSGTLWVTLPSEISHLFGDWADSWTTPDLTTFSLPCPMQPSSPFLEQYLTSQLVYFQNILCLAQSIHFSLLSPQSSPTANVPTEPTCLKQSNPFLDFPCINCISTDSRSFTTGGSSWNQQVWEQNKIIVTISLDKLGAICAWMQNIYWIYTVTVKKSYI